MTAIRTGLSQNLRLSLNQSLIQGLHILRMPLHDLEARIRQEIQDNPFVDEVFPSVKKEIPGGGSAPMSQNLFREGSGLSSQGSGESPIWEKMAGPESSFREKLSAQAAVSAVHEDELSIYREIIYLLDDRGFFTDNVEVIARDLETGPDHIKKILEEIREFEPEGCGLPGVREFLIYQTEGLDSPDPLQLEIISKLFPELEKYDYEKIARKLKVDLETVIRIAEKISSLRPYPSFGEFSAEKGYISPDLEAYIENGELIIRLNDEYLPKIVINSYHKEILGKKNIEKKVKNYIQDQLGSARALTAAIASRNETLKRVALDVMEFQRGFIEKGPGFLEPMTMRETAERLSLDISTVSRAVSGKYVRTVWGLFGLKHFFSYGSARRAHDAADISADGLMKRIRELIENEPPEDPRTDSDLAVVLGREGIISARRTVSKYRDLMGIPSSNIRKKINKIKKLKGTI